MNKLVLFFTVVFSFVYGHAQRPDVEYKAMYPVGDDANIFFETKYYKTEPIIFEANPIARYSFYNNIHKRLLSLNSENKGNASALYAVFKPQLRMYAENSLPVKMPSYKIQLGYQYMWIYANGDFFTIAAESGHYSNGQSGCAFCQDFSDGSAQCDSVYKTITPKTNLSQRLNRTNGNFSTNLTQVQFNYRFNRDIRNRIAHLTYSATIGATLYHDRFWGLFDFGGYSDNDIKIYGRMRYNGGLAVTWLLGDAAKPSHITAAENIELIQGAHPFVDPFRSVLSVSYFPVGKFREFGISLRYVAGHDDYNFRFVDTGSQVGFGLVWSPFFPIQTMHK